MMLNEVTAVPDAALPLAEFRDHLRLGTGFSDTGAEDVALSAYLRAALAAIEGRTAKALMARDFMLSLTEWRWGDMQTLPIAPVRAVAALRLIDGAGGEVIAPASGWRLVADMARPRLEARGAALPAIPTGGRVEIDFTAGFGPAWADLPVDLAQAVFLLAAQYYEFRHDGAGEGGALPFGVSALIERWRTVRMLGGRG
ncbi:head-tail connector protein [Rhodobacter lacus]|uniref:Gene transfer agent protein n=1 Tax=Rhodobacter lacus TaxID=1641972 RepID=A0ABW5ABH5_9RHOB